MRTTVKDAGYRLEISNGKNQHSMPVFHYYLFGSTQLTSTGLLGHFPLQLSITHCGWGHYSKAAAKCHDAICIYGTNKWCLETLWYSFTFWITPSSSLWILLSTTKHKNICTLLFDVGLCVAISLVARFKKWWV